MERIYCNLCEKDDSGPVFSKEGYNIVRCRNCGLVYVNPRPEERERAGIYEKGYFNGSQAADFLLEGNLYRARFKEKLKAIYRRKAGGRILDIGCAVGHFLEIARDGGWETRGVEISPFASQKAREKGIDVFTGTLKQAQYPDDFFDAVTMWHILEHVYDPRSTLKEVHRILKDKGLLVIEVPDFNCRRSKSLKQHWDYIKPREHLYYFTPSNLSALLKKTDFDILEMKIIPGGTGMGKSLKKFGLGSLKKRLIEHFSYISLFKKAGLAVKKLLGRNELLICYARKVARN